MFEELDGTAFVHLELNLDGRQRRDHLVEEGRRDAAVQLKHQLRGKIITAEEEKKFVVSQCVDSLEAD